MRFIDAWVTACFFDGRQDVFGTNVSHQIVAGKRAAAEAGERAVKAAAAGLIRCENFCFGEFRPAVEMRAELDSGDRLAGTFEDIGNYFWCGVASGVGERNGF